MKNEIKELKIEELAQGYSIEDDGNVYKCIYCGKTFVKGHIYETRAGLSDYEYAARYHIFETHGGPVRGLLGLGKEITGISDMQEKIIEMMYDGKNNKYISEILDINPATVRTHKFNIQQMKREAKILIALMENIEEEKYHIRREIFEKDSAGNDSFEKINERQLHPFFTQIRLK